MWKIINGQFLDLCQIIIYISLVKNYFWKLKNIKLEFKINNSFKSLKNKILYKIYTNSKIVLGLLILLKIVNNPI